MNTLIALVLWCVAPPPAHTTADAKPVPVTGVVVEPSGQPVSGADVWLVDALTADEDRHFGLELIWSSRTKASEGSIPVLVHGRTAAAGRFTLELPLEVVARRVPPMLAVWAASNGPDPRTTSRLLPRIVLADDPPLRLELGEPMRTQIIVTDTAHRPAAHAKIIVSRSRDLTVPDALGLALAVTTDSDGRGVISGLVPDEIRVQTPGFGAQTLTIPSPTIPDSKTTDSKVQPKAARIITVMLAPVGRVVGRLVAPGNEPIKGVMVKATTQVGGYVGSGQGGRAEVGCDAEGRFEIPAIAAGPLTLMLTFDRESGTRLRGEPPQKLLVNSNSTTQVTIPLRPTIKVHGQYRERETKRPIAGVKVVLFGLLGSDRHAISGTDGTWPGWISRDAPQALGWPVRIPGPYFVPGEMSFGRYIMPAAGSNELVVPLIELPRGVDVNGSVVNEQGEPVVGAQIEATWELSSGSVQSTLARTEHRGQFVLQGVDPIAELRLAAWEGFASTAAQVTIRADKAQTKPVVLTIAPKNTVPVRGRIVDPAGNPVIGASIELWRRVPGRNGREMVVEPILFGDPFRSIRTDSQGRYRSPRRLALGGECYARAFAPGRLAAFSGAVKLTGESGELPAIVLRRVRTIEGQIIDRQAKPVAGALVRQSGDGPMPTEATTSQDGHFQLAGVLEGPAVLFAEKDGFWFHLQPIDDGPKPIKVVQTRTTETHAKIYQTVASARPVEEEIALAQRLIQPLAKRVLAEGKDDEKLRFLSNAIDVDRSAALEWLGIVKFNDPDYNRTIRLLLVRSLAREHLDEATALVEASADVALRATGYAAICELRRDLDPIRLRELLAQATLNVRAPTAPPVARINVADRLIDLGEIDQARKLLREAEGSLKEATKCAARPVYTHGQIARVLARSDLPAALAILDDLDRIARKTDSRDATRILDRHIGAVASSLAAQTPADAERVLARLSLRLQTVRTVAAVCFKMAPKDLARARRISDSRVSPDVPAYRSHTLGLMALAIAATDRPAAARLIGDAYKGLEDLATTGGPSVTAFDPLTVAMGLLPVVEQVEPERLAECLGRTLALRPATGDQSDPGEIKDVWSRSTLATMVARYNRQLAARLLDPELRELGTHSIRRGVGDFSTGNVLSALALMDPQQAVDRVLSLPDDVGPGTNPMATKNWASMEVAKILAKHGALRWRYLQEHRLNLWTPDQEDF